MELMLAVQDESLEEREDYLLNDEILNAIIEFQSICDRHRASIQMQDELLRFLFEGMGTCKGKKSSKESHKKSLASLLVQKPREWDGRLNNIMVPCNWTQLIKIYKERGMVPLQEWKLCIGGNERVHDPQVLEPSLEDAEEAEALKCRCIDMPLPRLLRRQCERCCERCVKCNKRRSEMVPFHYISLIGQLKQLCQSEAICWDFLAMWRAKEGWLGKAPSEAPQLINEFWDGEKTRIYQDFWNPHVRWEAPIICDNSKCQRAHKAFPKEVMCTAMQGGWNEEQQEYAFRCTKCGRELHSKRRFIQVHLLLGLCLTHIG